MSDFHDLYKYIDTEIEELTEIMLRGVGDFSEYKHLTGRARALSEIREKIAEIEKKDMDDL